MAIEIQSFKQHLGQRILALRKEARMTQSELAEAAGVGNEYISKIERGLGSPSLETLVKIAQALQVETKMLFDLRARPSRPVKKPLAKLFSALENLEKRDLDLVYTLARRLSRKRGRR